MNLSLKRVTKYFALALVGLALMAASGTWTYAATTATATPLLTVTVGTAATASATAVTFASPGSDFTGNYTGDTTLTFGIRTTASGGTGSITVEGSTEFSPINGPSIAGGKLSYTCAVGDLTEGTPAQLGGGYTYCTGGTTTVVMNTPKNVLAPIGANARTSGATLLVHFIIPEDASYPAATYTGNVRFTVTAN